MKVFVDFSCLKAYPAGIPVYVKQLYNALAKLFPEIQVYSGYKTYNDATYELFIQNIHNLIDKRVNNKRIPFPGRLFFNIPLLKNCFSFHSKDYDVVHFPGQVGGPLWVPFDRLDNLVLTVHDMFVFYDMEINAPCSSQVREFILKNLPLQADRCAHILTVSEFSKKEILKFLGDRVSPQKITVTPNSVQWSLEDIQNIPDFPLSCCPELKSKNYFLSVSSLMRHKNYETLLESWKRYHELNLGNGDSLVIVGAGVDLDITRKVEGTSGVIHLSNVSQKELLALYKNALGFFLLSRIEGFGIPLLEAMLCGCPACYARGSSMDEIGGEDAWALDPDDVCGVTELFARFREGDQELLERSKKARETALEKFTWEKTAQKTFEVFQKVCYEKK